MILTPTQQSFSQLNQQLTQIVKRYSDNQTSYFPNVEKVIQAFQEYLECVKLGKQVIKESLMESQMDCFVFREKVGLIFLSKMKRFIQMVIAWDFGFSQEFQAIMKEKSLRSSKEEESFLSDVSASQIVFLMYIGLEVERKEILGKDFNFDKKRTFVLKEVIQTLQECFQNNDEPNSHHDSIFSFNSFEINQEKLLEKIQQKTFKLRLQKENFSFSPLFKSSPKSSPKNDTKTINQSIDEILKKASEMERNESLVSVKSEFVESQFFEAKRKEVKKDGVNVKEDCGKMEFSAKKFSNEEVFKNIELRK